MRTPVYRDSAVREFASRYPAAEYEPGAGSCMEARKYCAYNQTRGRFLGSEIDAADFSVASLNERMPALAPSSGAGLWLVPFRGISATNVRAPLDLVYLDPNCTVIDAIESFPMARVSPSSPLAASVLALPSQTIGSTETQPGDQLLLCDPEEMKRRLQRLPALGTDTGAGDHDAPSSDDTTRGGRGRLLQFEDRFKTNRLPDGPPNPDIVDVEHPKDAVAVETRPAVPEQSEKKLTEPASKNVKPAKNWLQRWLNPDPPEPRKALRESLPGLAAFFWTGGASVEHQVRDISTTGLFVITEERWYPGTVVRMTLTDRWEPTVERSITANMTVVRWGNDGVGLQFVVHDPKAARRGLKPMIDTSVQAVDQHELDQFLDRIRSAKR